MAKKAANDQPGRKARRGGRMIGKATKKGDDKGSKGRGAEKRGGAPVPKGGFPGLADPTY